MTCSWKGTLYIGDAFIADWPQTLERLRALDYDVYAALATALVHRQGQD